jgi:hypothetical protein
MPAAKDKNALAIYRFHKAFSRLNRSFEWNLISFKSSKDAFILFNYIYIYIYISNLMLDSLDTFQSWTCILKSSLWSISSMNELVIFHFFVMDYIYLGVVIF